MRNAENGISNWVLPLFFTVLNAYINLADYSDLVRILARESVDTFSF